MAQILRPISDTSIGGFTNESGSTTNLFASIDEGAASDADYVISSAALSQDSLTVKLTATAIDPLASNDHFVDYRIGKIGTNGIDWRVRLLQGATEIASWMHYDVAVGPTTINQTLTTTQADAITDYEDLYLEYTVYNDIPIGQFEHFVTIPAIRDENNQTERSISELKYIDGQLWPSYGDFNLLGGSRSVMTVDPYTAEITEVDDVVTADYYRVFETSNGNIFLLYADPSVGTWPMYQKRISGVWSTGGSDVLGAHAFDFIEWGGAYYICGSRADSFGQSEPIVWKSTNEGASWTVDLSGPEQPSTSHLRRYYFFMPFSDKLYVGRIDTGATLTRWFSTSGSGWAEETTDLPMEDSLFNDYCTYKFTFNNYLFVYRTYGGSITFSSSTGLPSGVAASVLGLSEPRNSTDTPTIMGGNAVYDVAFHEGTKTAWAITQLGTLMRSTDGLTVRVAAHRHNLPRQPRSMCFVGNSLFIGDAGGTIWKATINPLPTRDVRQWLQATDSPTANGWTETDTDTQLGFGTSFMTKDNLSSAGSWGDPRVVYTAGITRSNTFRLFCSVLRVQANSYYWFGLARSTTPTGFDYGAASIGRDNGLALIGHPTLGSTRIYDPISAEDYPGREYMICLRATGAVMYARGLGYNVPYKHHETSVGQWLPIGIESVNTQATIYPAIVFNGGVARQALFGHMEWDDSFPPHIGDVEDTFDRADNATSLGNTATSQTWNAVVGTWGVSSNQAYSTTTSSTNLAVVESGVSDGIISVSASSLLATSYGGLVFRSDGTDQNYWRVYYDRTNFKIDKVVGGVVTNMHVTADTAASGIINVTLYGSRISVHKGATGGTVATIVIDDAALSTNTQHGLLIVNTSTTGARLNNFLVFGPMT